MCDSIEDGIKMLIYFYDYGAEREIRGDMSLNDMIYKAYMDTKDTKRGKEYEFWKYGFKKGDEWALREYSSCEAKFKALREYLSSLPDHQSKLIELAKVRRSLNDDKDITNTALHLAVTSGDIKSVRKLIDAKVDLDARTSEGETALHLAAAKGHSYTVKLLLDAGANKHCVARGYENDSRLCE